MVNARHPFEAYQHAGASQAQPEASLDGGGEEGGQNRRQRFNVLLAEGREQNVEHWTYQLPRLMEPMGVRSYQASTGRQALDLTTSFEIHAALIDLATPPDEQRSAGADEPGGLWLLELLRREARRPPVVVIHSRAYTERQAQRFLNDALRLGAFSVLSQPIQLNDLLTTIQRLIDRNYRGQWPETHETQ